MLAKLTQPRQSNLKQGFLIVEVLMILILFIIISGLFAPLTINFYRSGQINAHVDGVSIALRRAQIKSLNSEDDSAFGFYIDSEKYILFKGAEYKSRDESYDEIFYLPDGLTVSGLDEVGFDRITGIPSDTGDIILMFGNKSQTVSINEVGMVDYQ
jgi:hypothetical protein